jgi:hypothetical protein
VAGENAMLFRAVQERGGKKYDNKRQISNNQQKEKKKKGIFFAFWLGLYVCYSSCLGLEWD